MSDYTLVIAVDRRHLAQLAVTWPTWVRHKPDLARVPMVVIYDHEQVGPGVIHRVLHRDMSCIPWPPPGVTYPDTGGKWGDGQRYKMLAGFVYCAARAVDTKYWLKLDVDTVATGHPDWIDPVWFADNPAIAAQGWGYTKPPDQMLLLDKWVADNAAKLPALANITPPLNLAPNPGSSIVKHKRIISWAGFFDTDFTNMCAVAAEQTCGHGYLPVQSQDGFMWYCAARLGLPIMRVDMKSRGWEHWTTFENIQRAAARAMGV